MGLDHPLDNVLQASGQPFVSGRVCREAAALIDWKHDPHSCLLMKLGPRWWSFKRKIWKPRFFVLTGSALFYLRGRDSPNPRKIFYLRNFSCHIVKEDPKSKIRWLIQLSHPDMENPLLIRAGCEEDFLNWRTWIWTALARLEEGKVVKTQAIVRKCLERKRYLKMKHAAIHLQSVARMWSVRSARSEEIKSCQRRARISLEILHSERAYVESLRVIEVVFRQPMLQTKTISENALNTIFAHIPGLYTVHQDLLRRLNDRWTALHAEQGFVKCFTEMLDYFNIYKPYVLNYDEACNALGKAQKQRKVRNFLEAAQKSEECCGLGLESFLIMPVQRLPRYVLLFNELKKHTPRTFPEYKLYDGVVSKLSSLATLVNESKRVADQQAALVVIRDKIIGDVSIVEPWRRFVKEGQLGNVRLVELQNTKKHEKPKTYLCHAFLFNDLLLLCKYAKKGLLQKKDFKSKWVLPLTDIAVRRMSRFEEVQREISSGLKIYHKQTVFEVDGDQSNLITWVGDIELTQSSHSEEKQRIQSISLRPNSRQLITPPTAS